MYAAQSTNNEPSRTVKIIVEYTLHSTLYNGDSYTFVWDIRRSTISRILNNKLKSKY